MNVETISYRNLELTDLPDAALIIERVNAQRDGRPLPDALSKPDATHSLAVKLGKAGAWGEIAIVQDRCAGVVLGYPASEATDLPTEHATAHYISLLMVEPEHWGKRIASTLLDRAVERTWDAGRERLVLLTRKYDNRHAQTVYEHKGYVKTKHTRSSKYGEQVLYLLDLA